MADRGRRALPSANRLVTERMAQHSMQLHHDRLRNMKQTPVRCKTVDNKEPDCMKLTHLKTRAAQKQKQADRQVAIDHENQVLLKKLESIYTRDIAKSSKPAYYRTSLHTVAATRGVATDKSAYPYVDCILKPPPSPIRHGHQWRRKQEAQRIVEENEGILRRIQDARPLYSSKKLDEFAQDSKRLAELASRPEIKHLSASLRSSGAPTLRRPESRLNASMTQPLGPSLAATGGKPGSGNPNADGRPDTYVGSGAHVVE
ncbi:unnamed protein product [Pedinophyceae sp. YPF-701]|nr:unnamed protein product [Pedinophyceae sp. YPF-701]